ncbi:MAG: cysteine hydrolase [Candidatus Vogelbacteria bacterium]|nr:cysteine hydrolase [Candidatus Vogelbacteria bacterium]
MKAALLVIDLQKDFFRSERLQSLQSALTDNTNVLIDTAQSKNIPIIWVRQEMKADMSNAPLGDRKEGKSFVVAGTEGAQLLDGLQKQLSDYEIVKTRYSPFFKTELDDLLKKLVVDTLILSGINTHACVRMAAIDAYERDYEIILATDCINSWDEEHHRVSLKYLSGKITHPMTNEEIKLLS